MGLKYQKIMGFLSILNIFMPMSVAINSDCDYYQEMIIGQDYYIYNQEYPSYYGPSTSCRWVGQSPVGSVIVISCNDIYIPASVNCESDRVSISLSGDPTFQDAINFCGVTRTTEVTPSNSIAVGLFTASNSAGGRFVCTLTAMQVAPTSPPIPTPNDCDCGWKQETRIVGGEATGVNEYPSMAVIVEKSTGNAYCGATIISERYATTAAHCVRNYQPSELSLLVGDHDLSTNQDTSAAASYDISAFEAHPNYNITTQQDDIAIIQTSKNIEFSRYVGPACLPFRYSTYDFYSQIVTALGWGFQDISGNKSNVLQEVDLSIVSTTECDEKIPEPVSYYKQICTYAPEKDTCLSDSGGPLLWQDPTTRRLHLVGIISYGVGCATTRPAVNTRVTAYLQWILSLTSDAVYCIK